MAKPEAAPVAVLTSGGLDSAILLADLAAAGPVYLLYLRAGLAWESEERSALARFIAAAGHQNIRPVVEIEAPVAPLLDGHWSVTGCELPAAGTPDSAVFIPGRNIVLIGMAAVWCSVHGVGRIAIGSLGANPFPDASPGFFQDFGAVLSRGLAHTIEVMAPYRDVHKDEILRRFQHLPLELTVTCMRARDGLHCGECNKCEERRQAFLRAGVQDRTRYRT